jgi:hypothetical protein
MTHLHCIDTSDELLISRCDQGVQLLRPDQMDPTIHLNAKTSLGSLKKMPFNVYLLDPNSRIQTLNDPTIATIGFDSLKDGLGKCMLDILPRENALQLMKIDQLAMRLNQTKMVDDIAILNDGTQHHFLTVKTPLYDMQHQVVGVFGCSILLTNQPLATAIAEIVALGLLQPQSTGFEDQFLVKLKEKNIHLSPREIQVLTYLVRGKSARETGEIIHLSQRTIEFLFKYCEIQTPLQKKIGFN